MCGWGCAESRYTGPLKRYSFVVVIDKEPEDPGYFAYSPSLRGCFSNGDTIEETRANMREALDQHVETMLEDGVPIPQDYVFYVEELALGVPA